MRAATGRRSSRRHWIIRRCGTGGTPALKGGYTGQARTGRDQDGHRRLNSYPPTDESTQLPQVVKLTTVPDILESIRSWIADVTDAQEVTVLRGLRLFDGGQPWLIDADGRQLVLRVTPHEEVAPTEVAAMRLAADAGLPVPPVLAHQDNLLLMPALTGDSLIPAEPDPRRLRALGAAAARIASIPVTPTAALPARTRPIPLEDFEAMRRDADYIDPLIREAEAAVERAPLSDPSTGLVHGDLWYGNTTWTDGELTAILDWDCAGTGSPGIDLATLRIDAAFCYGCEAADEILAGWEDQAGHPLLTCRTGI
jgi:aminoglycoside phosphotransferase (APT) family kinase protein